jgi:hypothetical protein
VASQLLVNEHFIDFDTYGWQKDITGRSSQANIVEDVTLPGRRIFESNTTYCDDELCYRAELKTRLDRRLDILPSNEGEYWIGFTLQIPADWVYLDDVYTSATPFRAYFFQIHGGDNLGRPPIIGLRNEGHRMSVNICGNNDYSSPTKECVYRAVGDVAVAGEWEDWVIYDKLSSNPDGVVKVWRNGALVLDESNIRTSFNDSTPHYLKLGTYVPTWKDAVNSSEVLTSWTGSRFSSLKFGNASSSYAGVKTSITDMIPGFSVYPTGTPSTAPSLPPAFTSHPSSSPSSSAAVGEEEPASDGGFIPNHLGTLVGGMFLALCFLIILRMSWYLHSRSQGEQDYTTTPGTDTNRAVDNNSAAAAAKPTRPDSVRNAALPSNSVFSYSNVYENDRAAATVSIQFTTNPYANNQ